MELMIPWSRGDVLAAAHREGEVLLEQHEEHGTRIQARFDEVSQRLLADFVVDDVSGSVE